MHPEDIKAALRKKGSSASEVARALNVEPGTVSNIIHSRYTSRRIALRISRVIGVPVSQLWPGRYPRIELAEIREAA